MSAPRHDDNRLVEIEAALELLQQVKEDTFNLIMNLQEAIATADPKMPPSRQTRRPRSWMAPQAESDVVNADE